MVEQEYYSAAQFNKDVAWIADWIRKYKMNDYDSIFGVPQGGVPFAVKLSGLTDLEMVEKPGDRTLIVDDIIDSGATRMKWPDHDFVCLHIKNQALNNRDMKQPIMAMKAIPTYVWMIYFWENDGQGSIKDSVIRQLQYIGEDVTREGLAETPKRVVKSWDRLYGGYHQTVEDILKVFDSGGYDEIVLLKDIEFYSTCEHHLLPFFGKAHIAYIPDDKVIGISKLARLMEMYSRRLQIQERIGEQITVDLMKHLNAKAAACIIEAQHFCMRARGVEKQNSIMTTSSMKGAFLDKPAARMELMSLIK